MGAQNLSAKFRPLIVQLTKADQAPLTIKAEKRMKVYQMLRKSILGMIIHGSMIGSGLVMVGSALTPATASASSHEDFNFTNKTGTTITGLYMAPNGTNQSWGHNCLSSPLKPGETRHISWPTEPGIPIWDVRVTYSTGVEAEFYRGVDLSAHDLLVVSLLEDGTASNLNVI
jgi:hypothetical protein